MTTDDLLKKVQEKIVTMILPDETLQAILDLGKERDFARESVRAKEEEILALNTKVAAAEANVSQIEFAKGKAESLAKDQAWIANELGKFVSDIANGIYEGKEIAAARRVYDLNGSSMKKKHVNAADYESEEEARTAFEKQFVSQTYTMQEYLDWLFSAVEKKA